MKAMTSVYVLSVVLGVCFADPACNGITRTACENIFTAQKCGMLTECLRVWKESRWGKYRTDVSADCTFCLHITSSPRNERSSSLICAAFPTNTSNVRSLPFDTDTCVDVAMRLQNVTSGKDDGIALCNVLKNCQSHTFIGHLNFGSTLCDDCKKVVQDIRALISDNATSDAIASKLNAVICANIPEQLQNYCKETIKVHVRPVLDLINRQISPQDICALLGLCPKQQNMDARISNLLSPTLFSEEVVYVPPATHTVCPNETKFSWISRPSARHPRWTSRSRIERIMSKVTDKPSGSQCVAVMSQIRMSLKDPSQQAKIKENIDREVCSPLPTFLRTMCSNAVNEHFDEMMEHLDKVDLKKICAMFGMPPDYLQKMSPPSIPTASIPGVCKVCELVVAKVIEMTLRGATEKQITEALDKVCHLIPPGPYEMRCETFVEQFGAKIVTEIIAGSAPGFICTSLGVCTPVRSTPTAMVPPVQPIGDTYCDTCKLLVTMIEHQLVQNETEDQVKELLKSLCKVLPSSYTEECMSLVDRYLPVVMDYLTRKVKPEEVCKAIQLCPNVRRPTPCLRGPAYWCSSRAAAVQCKAELYCQQTFRTLDPGAAAEPKCEATDMDEICGSPELVVECGKSNECLNRQMVQYLKLVSQHTHEALQYPQSTQNCTVCEQLVARWQLHKTLFGASIVDKDTCVTYAEQVDRDQCKLVLDNTSEIFGLLAQKATDTKAVCKSLALCQVKIQDSGISGRVVENLPENVGTQVLACSEGPVFWCASKRNAEACGTVNFCNALSWFGEKETKPKPTTLLEVDVDIFGVNACAWGSVYWCQSEETARRCGALDHCRTAVWRSAHSGPKLQTQQVKLHRPSNPCLWGPSYYCSSPEKALECGQHYVEHCWQIAMRRSHS
ncbi:hypothetical protein CRM22_004618 [Opisthorchis felineus]|uniref:Saposin B-type domain-containing protein n=1 Tax=Opisthorchis felineus TaxID=147828 RepID=A0A4S2LV98_OPIFE|nr:hypothetical protein CRM22_004618 [Opisthorchis felineus]